LERVEFEGPRKIIAYQMMGKNSDINLRPFLQIHSSENSPPGAFKCKMYEKCPLACRIYPVLDECKKREVLNGKCRFCCKFATTSSERSNLYEEIRALNIIKERHSQRKNARFGDMQWQLLKRSIKQNFWPRVDSSGYLNCK
jgi:hypothetical protein